jgi:hydrogenase maturation protease
MQRELSGKRTLVAGVGNIFFGDDGFGGEVVQRLLRVGLPAGVEVADFGIRGLHLAYELVDGRFDSAILVDALQRGGAPGTVYRLEPELETRDPAAPGTVAVADAHGMTPDVVLQLLGSLGGRRPRRVIVIGCEPATLDEGIGLSATVERGVDEAVRWILDLLPAAPESGAGVES